MSGRFRFLLPVLTFLAALLGAPGMLVTAQANSVIWDQPTASYQYIDGPRVQRQAVQPRKAKRQRAAYQRHAAQSRKVQMQRKARHAAERRRIAATTVNRQQVSERRVLRRNAAALRRAAEARRLDSYPSESTRARRYASLGNEIEQRGERQSAGRVEASVDVRSQRMVVKVDGEVRHVWKVSTGRTGFATPRGTYGPQRMHARYFSKKYYNSPMPYSIFFRGGYAIHGTTAVNRLGGPASHGCIRLATSNARTLFQLVKSAGAHRTRIVIT